MEEAKAIVEVAAGFQITSNGNLPELDSCSGNFKGGSEVREIGKSESVRLGNE